MVVHQGDIFWVNLPDPEDCSPGERRSGLIIQNDSFNSSKLSTVVCVLITSNLVHAGKVGNTRLRKGEANLIRPSVINGTQIYTVDRSMLGKKIGTLTFARFQEAWADILLVIGPLPSSG